MLSQVAVLATGSASLAAAHVACRSSSAELGGPHRTLRVHWPPRTRAQALQISTLQASQRYSVCFKRSWLQVAHRRDFLVEVLLQLRQSSVLPGSASMGLPSMWSVIKWPTSPATSKAAATGVMLSSLTQPEQSQLAHALHS